MKSAFDNFISLFHQDILSFQGFDEAVSEAVGGLTLSDKQELTTYLNTIHEDSSANFVVLWNDSESPFELPNEIEAREVLAHIIKVLRNNTANN